MIRNGDIWHLCEHVFQNISWRLGGLAMVVMVVMALVKVKEVVVVMMEKVEEVVVAESPGTGREHRPREAPGRSGESSPLGGGEWSFQDCYISNHYCIISEVFLFLTKWSAPVKTIEKRPLWVLWKEMIIVVWVITLRELRAVFTSNYLQMLPPASNPSIRRIFKHYNCYY